MKPVDKTVLLWTVACLVAFLGLQSGCGGGDDGVATMGNEDALPRVKRTVPVEADAMSAAVDQTGTGDQQKGMDGGVAGMGGAGRVDAGGTGGTDGASTGETGGVTSPDVRPSADALLGLDAAISFSSFLAYNDPFKVSEGRMREFDAALRAECTSGRVLIGGSCSVRVDHVGLPSFVFNGRCTGSPPQVVWCCPGCAARTGQPSKCYVTFGQNPDAPAPAGTVVKVELSLSSTNCGSHGAACEVCSASQQCIPIDSTLFSSCR